MMSMRRKIKGKSPEEIRELKREELDQPVTIQDFEEAIIRQAILHKYTVEHTDITVFSTKSYVGDRMNSRTTTLSLIIQLNQTNQTHLQSGLLYNKYNIFMSLPVSHSPAPQRRRQVSFYSKLLTG